MYCTNIKYKTNITWTCKRLLLDYLLNYHQLVTTNLILQRTLKSPILLGEILYSVRG